MTQFTVTAASLYELSITKCLFNKTIPPFEDKEFQYSLPQSLQNISFNDISFIWRKVHFYSIGTSGISYIALCERLRPSAVQSVHYRFIAEVLLRLELEPPLLLVLHGSLCYISRLIHVEEIDKLP